MIKEIYAVKSGGKRGIFKKEIFLEQINHHPISRYHSFVYRSELEEEPEDVPGSLRHAIRKAAEYLGDLVYLGGCADYLEDVSWVEDGFLPFGYEPEADDPEIFPDNRDTLDAPMGSWETEYRKIAGDIEGYVEWPADERNALDAPVGSWEIEYWKIAEDMKECIELIKHGGSNTKKKAAANLKRHLQRCIDDANLNDLTAGYKDLRKRNAIGYDPPAVAEFVTQLLRRYPKP